MTRPVFVALAGLIALGVAAVLVGAAVHERQDPTFHPDWAVWAPVSLGIGLGILGLASLAVLAQRLPPRALTPAGPFPRPVAAGTERALLRQEPLTPQQVASVQDLVDRLGSRRQLWAFAIGPLYFVVGGVGSIFGGNGGLSLMYLVLGAAWCAGGMVQLHRRRRVLDSAAQQGFSPTVKKAL